MAERETPPLPSDAEAIEAGLLQVVYQSFDSGGESARSLRARALESVLQRMIKRVGFEAFAVEKTTMEANPFDYVQKANWRLAARPAVSPSIEGARQQAFREGAKAERKLCMVDTQVTRIYAYSGPNNSTPICRPLSAGEIRMTINARPLPALEALASKTSAPQPIPNAPQRAAAMWKFSEGMLVRKISGSKWHGRVVGFYSTDLTPRGYAIESDAHPGSVQIYPEAALEALAKSETE